MAKLSLIVVLVGLSGCLKAEEKPDAPPPPDAAPCIPGTLATTVTARGYGTSINGALDKTVVCVHGRPDIPCEQTIGSFASLCMPTGVDVVVKASKFGWQSALHLYPPDLLQLATELQDDPFAQLVWTQAGGTYPSTTDGYVIALVCDATTCPDSGASNVFTGIPNLTVALDPIRPPVYGDMTQFPDPTATMTTSSGVIWFANVPPGMYDITVTGATGTCRMHDRLVGRGGGFASPVAGAAARFPVIASTMTAIVLRCTP